MSSYPPVAEVERVAKIIYDQLEAFQLSITCPIKRSSIRIVAHMEPSTAGFFHDGFCASYTHKGRVYGGGCCWNCKKFPIPPGSMFSIDGICVPAIFKAPLVDSFDTCHNRFPIIVDRTVPKGKAMPYAWDIINKKYILRSN